MNATRAIFLAAAGVILTGLALPKLAGDTDTAPVSVTPTSVPVPTSAAPTPTLAPTPPVRTPPPADPIALPGPVPARGEGTFQYGTAGGPVFGRGGTVHRYRVAVERGSNEDVAEFVVAVDKALGDQRSWIAGGHRMQRVPDGQAHEFTVYLATGETAQRMCAAGGVNIQAGGRPYTSCRTSGRVIINLDRWRLSIPDYTSAKVPLSVYRTYVVNHEVGHQLGRQHELCPGAGRPAPVMMQQTLGLDGCAANPWPYLNGRRYTGPLK